MDTSFHFISVVMCHVWRKSSSCYLMRYFGSGRYQLWCAMSDVNLHLVI
jgi:hypothetical protein